MDLINPTKNRPVVYVARDIERALGILPEKGSSYFIISNASVLGETMAARYPDNIFLIKEPSGKFFDTHELLELPFVEEKIATLKAALLVFKNTLQIERICAKNKWQLLNPSAALSKRVEEKISQVEWLGELSYLLPPHSIQKCKDVSWTGQKFILQFNHGHTGESTYLIENEAELSVLQQKFPEREAKRSLFIDGPVYTSNIIVGDDALLCGNISYQITGLSPFTKIPFSTVGNDWGLPTHSLNEREHTAYAAISTALAKKMQHNGWRGLFGIDIKIEKDSGKVYLLEINARQPASSVFESKLQKNEGGAKLHGTSEESSPSLTVFEAHLAALLNLPLQNAKIIPITSGGQLVMRFDPLLKEDISQTEKRVGALAAQNLSVILYNNTTPNADFIRIQSQENLMADTEHLNKLGQSIADILECKL